MYEDIPGLHKVDVQTMFLWAVVSRTKGYRVRTKSDINDQDA